MSYNNYTILSSHNLASEKKNEQEFNLTKNDRTNYQQKYSHGENT